jgi:hypothetical protein
MGTLTDRALVTLAVTSLLMGCAGRNSGLAPSPGSEAIAPTFVFRNLSSERIAVYLVEDTQETMLRRLEPLESARLPLPDRFFTGQGGSIRLAVIVNGPKSLQPSHENGVLLSLRRSGASLVGQTWVFAAGQLSEP